MKNVPIQFLEPLSHQDCRLLLAKHAFGNENYSANSNLEDIGKQIALKCKGLPLATQTLGVFPNDYEFEKEDVVQLWTVEGLVTQVDNGKIMELVARKYFDELLSRSLSKVKRIQFHNA
ncbi:unnamed protein product [Prunus armeniaca]